MSDQEAAGARYGVSVETDGRGRPEFYVFERRAVKVDLVAHAIGNLPEARIPVSIHRDTEGKVAIIIDATPGTYQVHLHARSTECQLAEFETIDPSAPPSARVDFCPSQPLEGD